MTQSPCDWKGMLRFQFQHCCLKIWKLMKYPLGREVGKLWGPRPKSKCESLVPSTKSRVWVSSCFPCPSPPGLGTWGLDPKTWASGHHCHQPTSCCPHHHYLQRQWANFHSWSWPATSQRALDYQLTSTCMSRGRRPTIGTKVSPLPLKMVVPPRRSMVVVEAGP